MQPSESSHRYDIAIDYAVAHQYNNGLAILPSDTHVVVRGHRYTALLGSYLPDHPDLRPTYLYKPTQRCELSYFHPGDIARLDLVIYYAMMFCNVKPVLIPGAFYDLERHEFLEETIQLLHDLRQGRLGSE